MVQVLICVGLLLTCVAPQLTSSLSLVQEDWVDKAAGVITERIGRYAAHEIKFNLMAVCRWALCVWWGWGCRWGWRWAGDVESTQRQPAYVQEVRWQACMQAGSYAGWQLPAPRGGCSPGSCRGIRQGGVGRLTCPFPSPISWRGLPAGILAQSASHFCPPCRKRMDLLQVMNQTELPSLPCSHTAPTCPSPPPTSRAGTARTCYMRRWSGSGGCRPASRPSWTSRQLHRLVPGVGAWGVRVDVRFHVGGRAGPGVWASTCM